MIVKHFSSSSAGVLLEKVRKNLGMFRHKMSTRKSFFSKTIRSSSKKEFRHILFPWKFRKMFRKKKPTKTFRKIDRACFDEYFCKYFLKFDKTYLQISFKTLSRLMPNPLEDIFHSCPCLIWWSHSGLISFRLFYGIWWKCKDGFFPELLTQPIAA